MYLMTEAIIDFFKADYACIWIIGSGDLCDTVCFHEKSGDRNYTCSDQRTCLHLIASSGRYTHFNWSHARIPLGAYKIGRIASGEEEFFVTNDVMDDPQIPDSKWASSMGLVSFSGFKLSKPDGTPVGVLALFSRHLITEPDTNKLLDIASITSMVIQTGLAERSLQESEEKFISIFKETPDAILIMNRGLQIIEVNRKFEEIFGSDRKDTGIISVNEFSSSAQPSALQDLLTSAFEHEVPASKELILMNKAGAPFVAEVSVSPVMIQGSPCLMVQIHDIDEMRRAYDAISQANHKLNILSNITRHDILNRIMIISSYSGILSENTRDQVDKKQLNAIYKASGEIQNLVEFTRYYQDLGALSPIWQKLSNIFKKSSIKSLLTDITLYADLDSLEIYADQMLEKVLYNLIENSKRHGQDLTWIQLTTRREGHDLLIIYEDDGGGVPDSEKNRIFEKGFGKNTGMGLFLITEILSITGITIRENGVFGEGVRFVIRIPPGKFRKGEL